MPANLIMDIPASLEVSLRELLAPDEIVEVKLKGAAKEVLVCTDRRVIVLKTGFLARSMFGAKLFQVPYGSISGVDVNFGLMFGVFEIVTGGNQYTRKSAWRAHGSDANASEAPNSVALNSRDQADLFRKACSHIVARIEGHRGGPGLPTPPAVSVADELRKLADLRKDGVLTSEEFETQKLALIGEGRGRLGMDAGDRTPPVDPTNEAPSFARADAAIQRALERRGAIAGQSGPSAGSPFGRRTSPPR